ncbi:hypothetical protein [Gordoniibacillus kamchatkensis]|uniref:hypothetical protein n=1 Tax=Gordoniibacillus kamchatkensis TaxID=1590651 RepID=UPI000ACB1DE9|nr:hypothetical protein [Paenibacillus sp. VKM B-2647]
MRLQRFRPIWGTAAAELQERLGNTNTAEEKVACLQSFYAGNWKNPLAATHSSNLPSGTL